MESSIRPLSLFRMSLILPFVGSILATRIMFSWNELLNEKLAHCNIAIAFNTDASATSEGLERMKE